MIDVHKISTNCTRNEFVGTAVLDTIGLVISGIDDTLLETMNVGMKYRCLGLFSSRTGAAGQITAIDDAVKATNTEVLSIELPRDTKGWAVASSALLGLIPGALGDVLSKIPILDVGVPAITSVYFDWFSGVMQAFIFCMLTVMYIANAAEE